MNRLSLGQKLAARRTEFGLLLAATVLVGLALVSLELTQQATLDSGVFVVIGGFIAVFTIAHLALCLTATYADQVLLPVAAALNGLGLVVLYRLNSALVVKQVVWSLVSVVLMIAVLVIVRDHRALSRFSYLLGLLGLVFLALPLVWPASGDEVTADAKIWISIGPFSVQPGEFSKILLLMFFAQLLVNKRALFNVAGKRFLGMDFPRLRDLGPLLLVWAIALLIMAAQNDFGPALLLFGTVLGMLFIASGRASWLLIGFVLAAAGGSVVYRMSTKIQTRFSNFIDPLANFYDSGNQLSQSLFGLSWGGITGTGLGLGSPDLIPVVHSDFILSAVGEELGLVGLSTILVLYAIFVQRGMKTALVTSDSYGKLLAAGLSLTLAIQVFVVVGGISAMLPMTGLTTPFMSAGGSSLMANYILLGILLRISNAARHPGSAPGDAAELTAGRSAVEDPANPHTALHRVVSPDAYRLQPGAAQGGL